VINKNNKFIGFFNPNKAESLIFCHNRYPSYIGSFHYSTFLYTGHDDVISEQIDKKLYSLLVFGAKGTRYG